MNIVVGFTQEYWEQWGVSWLATLKEFARFSGNVFFVVNGLSEITLQNLSKYGQVLHNDTINSLEIVKQIFSLMNSEEKYLFFDADVYFQDSFDELFSFDVLLLSNKGLFGGTKAQIEGFLQFYKITQLVQSYAFAEVMKFYGKYFPSSFYLLPQLPMASKLLHFGEFKNTPEAKKIQQKYSALFESWDNLLNKPKLRHNLILRSK